MGTTKSPDDAIFIGSYGNYSIDTYMQGIGSKVVIDTAVGGTNDTFGRYSYNSSDHYFTFEMVKKLDSGDTKGHDIALHLGDSINVMLAYWDNLPPTHEISGYSLHPTWIKLKILDTIVPAPGIVDYMIPLFFAVVISAVVIIIKYKF